MRNAGLEEAQAGIEIARTNSNILRYADDTTLMAESKEELKSLLMKEESEKADLKLNIQKTKIMASGPITSLEIDGKTVETVSDFIFAAPKSLLMVIAAMKLKDVSSLEGKLWPTQTACQKAETLLSQQRSIWSRLWFFQWSCMDVRVGQWRKLNTEELTLLNCDVEDSWEFLELQGDPTSPS